MASCKKMVKTNPEVGAIDRHPPDHRCSRSIWKDDFCRQHHPERIKEKDAERDKEDKAFEEKEIAIDAAIALLVRNRYRIEKY